jgi:hypothetical protein
MGDGSTGWRFERGLDADFMKKLKSVAFQQRWFADVLADPSLILGIRKNYVNVYRLGQSLFKIERPGESGPLTFSTHPKYLVDPDLYKAVSFDGSAFEVNKLEPLVEKYTGPETLERMKRAAKLYRGNEKDGVHAVVSANPNVIDTEVAFSHEAEIENGPPASRIDLASLEEAGSSIRLRFWEAKLYGNPDIRAEGLTAARVVEQIRRYRDLVEKHRGQIVKSYHRVACNLVALSAWASSSKRNVGPLVKRVADGEALVIDEPPMVGLIIYGYDDAQWKSRRWNTHLEKLTKESDLTVRHAGNAKNVRLVERNRKLTS